MPDILPRSTRETLFWALALLVALHFTLAYAFNTTPYLTLADYAAGTERLPFQNRALTGWVLRALHAGLGAPLPAIFASLVTASVLVILACARAIAFRLAGRGLFAACAGLALAVPLYILFVAPAYDYRFSYFYDLPSLALFTAALTAFLYDRTLACLALFALAALSRETCLLLIPIVLLWPTPALRARLRLAAGLSVLWLSAWVLVHRIYALNPRESVVKHVFGTPGGMVIELGNNWADLRDPSVWPALLSVFCWMWVPVLLLWPRLRHPGLRRVIQVTTPLWLLLMFTVGRLREVRVFAELTVVYWMAVVALIGDGLAGPAGGQEDSSPFSRKRTKSFCADACITYRSSPANRVSADMARTFLRAPEQKLFGPFSRERTTFLPCYFGSPATGAPPSARNSPSTSAIAAAAAAGSVPLATIATPEASSRKYG